MVLVPNIGISTSISNTTQIRPQHFGMVMCVYLEIEIFTAGSFFFDAGSHVEAWEMKIFTLACVPFDAGSHVEAWEM